MNSITLGEMEARFADMIWESAPVSSGTLVKLCAEKLGWKKSTSYTMLKRLCDKGLFKNDGGTVTPLVTKREYEAMRSESFIDDNFGGSLPRFVAAFTTRKRLDESEIEELERLIAGYRGGERP